MGISILQLDKIRRHETEDEEDDDDDDDLSEQNSEAALESASLQLRSELLTTEMLELAAEAERAAEAGQDHFAAQPCVFQDDGMAQPKMRRSYSEGTATRTASPPNRRRFLRRSTSTSQTKTKRKSRNKLSVVDLRDVHEVFPPFRQFHTHLRTHFFRGEVSQEQLYFDEPRKLQNPEGLFEEREITTIQSDGDMDGFRVDERLPPMLGSFRLNQWMRDPHRYAQGSVGEVVSSHISTQVPGRVRQVDVPPGLENEQPGTLRHAASSPEPTQVYSSSRVTDTSGNWGIGSLFQVDEPPTSGETKDEVRAPEYVAPESPPPAARTKAQDEEVRDFVTPVRLRKIRRPHRRKTYNRFLDSRRAVLPANSMSEDSPQKKSPTSPITTPLLPLPSLQPRNEPMQPLPALSPIEVIAPHDRLEGSELRRSLTPTEIFPLADGERTSSLRSSDRLGYSDNSLLESRARESGLRCRSVSPSGSVIDLDMDDDDDDEEASVDAHGPQRWNKPISRGAPPCLPFAGNRTGRALYARSKENDDFMSNFLYCSSQPADTGCSDSLHQRRDKEMWDQCGDGNFACGEGNSGFCCAATLLHDALSVDTLFHGPTVRKAAATTSTSSWVKFGTGTAASSLTGFRDAQTSWFGMANGRIDAAFEHVLGGGSTSTTRSFRAPTLRKKQVLPMEEETMDDLDQHQHYSFDIDEVSAAGRTSLLLEAQMAAA